MDYNGNHNIKKSLHHAGGDGLALFSMYTHTRVDIILLKIEITQ